MRSRTNVDTVDKKSLTLSSLGISEKLSTIEYLYQFFENQVDQTPHASAVIDGQIELTYRELDELANRWANYLLSYKIKPNDLIAIYLERSYKTVAIILGILKSGAGLIPIDPSSPVDRTKYILKHSKAKILISELAHLDRLPSSFDLGLNSESNIDLLVREDVERDLHNVLGLRPVIPHSSSSHDICYIIYTSGSTGEPKGVITEHSNTIHFVHSFSSVLGLTSADRVYHGFSYAFDGSVEEMWMTFASGATLVVCPEKIAKIASEVTQFIKNYRITFWATVPTMLKMITEDASSSSFKSLRILEVTGEPCSRDLVEKWARPGNGIRMLNVYGPTETCVNATTWECAVGKEITIGKPLPGYDLYILDAERRPIPFGEEGELYIGNGGVTRGYLGRDDLTEKQFVQVTFPHAEDGLSEGLGPGCEIVRLYKTGDIVRYNSEGELVFLGRNDSQVKLRGHRIELLEIECFLKAFSPIKQALVTVVDQSDLAAYVVLDNLNNLEKNSSPILDRDQLLDAMKGKFPPYMIPSTLDEVDSFPTLASGKINFKKLPAPKSALLKVNKIIISPQNSVEEKLVFHYCQLFKMKQISTTDDFFNDLGGHSLMAAHVAYMIREHLGMEVAIRDIYTYPTIQELASHLIHLQKVSVVEKKSEKEEKEEEIVVAPLWERYACYTLQLLTELLIYGVAGLMVAGAAFATFLYMKGSLDGWMLLDYAIPIGLALHPVMILITIIAKWTIIGRFKKGSYPLWGLYYYRWWLVHKLYSLSGAALFSGTPLLGLYLKMLGAKIGKNSIIDTEFIGSFDLITIGENVSICHETQLFGHRVENGQLLLGEVTLEKNCVVGIHSYLGLGVKMEEGSALGDLSALFDHQIIPKNEFWRGSPSKKIKNRQPNISNSVQHPVRSGIIFFAMLVLMECAPIPMICSLYSLIIGAYEQWGIGGMVLSLYTMSFFLFMGITLLVVALKWILFPTITPGVYSVDSWFYYRKWLFDSVMRLSTSFLRPLYTTIYLPTWLRMLGAKIGKGAEISVISQISPELLEIGEDSFLADSSIVGGRYYYDGKVEVALTRVGKRSFVGNSAILPLGQGIGNDSLLGCLSIPPEGYNPAPDKTDWLGSPSFRLPNRQKVYGLDKNQIFNPSKSLMMQRMGIDFARILMPGFIDVTMLLFFCSSLYLMNQYLSFGWTMILSPLVTAFTALLGLFMVVGVKKTVMGTFHPVIRPLWCRYIWFNEMINGIYESVFAPLVIPLMGTPFIAPLLRMMGVGIGKNCYIETTFFSEFDLVHIEDNVALNSSVIIQNHLFEDRVMKSSYLTIRSGCSVGNMSVVLYDTEMREGGMLAPLSLLMKGEMLPSGVHWKGIPCA